MKTDTSKEKLPRGIFRRNGIFWVRYTDVNGKLRREPGGGTVKQAEQKLILRRAMKQEGRAPMLRLDRLAELKAKAKAEEEAVAATEYFGDWIDAAKKHHKKHSSKKHAYDFERKCEYISAALGKLRVQKITRAAVNDWMEEAAEGGVTGSEEWGPASWNRYHSCFSSIFELAIKRAIGDGREPPLNPMFYIERRTEKWKERYWSTEEEERIIAATKEMFPGYEDIFVLAVELGYRKSEQLRAVVGDYNPRTHKITVHQRKTKTAPAARYVPLSDRGVAAYETLAKRKKPGAPLAVNLQRFKGEAMTDVRYWFDDVLTAAGIADELASWHVCRHTFCSRAVAAGVPITDVKEYAGHSDLRTTSLYTHGVEGESDVRNLQALNGRGKGKGKGRRTNSPEISALQEQIAALTALVQQLTPRT
jgi:integrase